MKQKSIQFNEDEQALVDFLNSQYNINKYLKDLIKNAMEKEQNKKSDDLVVKQLAREELYAQMRNQKFRDEIITIIKNYDKEDKKKK